MDTLVERDLIEYVVDQKTTPAGNKRIKEFCETQKKKSIILYRGHKNTKTIRSSDWHSASLSEKVAREEFAGETGYVFKIHLVNVPIINVNEYVGGKIGKYKEENEYIFLGGGVFYKNKELDTEGFVEKENNVIECWYSITEKKSSPKTRTTQSKYRQFLEIIPEEEYELINSPSDIFGDIDENTKNEIFKEIQKLKMKAGSKKLAKRRTRRNYRLRRHSRKIKY